EVGRAPRHETRVFNGQKMEQGTGEDEEKRHPQDGDDGRADLVGGVDDVIAPAAQEALRQPGEPAAGGFAGGSCAVHERVLGAAGPGGKDANDIRARLKAYAPVKLQVDLSQLGVRDREALGKIVAAVDAVDEIYWKQMGRQALEARQALAGATDPVDRLYRDFILINYRLFDLRK